MSNSIINKSYTWKNRSGWCVLTWTDSGITGFQFGFKSKKEALKYLKNKSSIGSDLKNTVKAIDRYFVGEKVEFEAPLGWTGATEFQKSVWHATMNIPYGETRSYGEMAVDAGAPKAARATGTALGANPIPVIVPCHRVLRANGAMGGFASGIEVKRALLDLEAGKHVRFDKISFQR